MQAELVMIGTELLLGQIVDTNAALLARHLADAGVSVYRKTTVGDNVARIASVIREALDRAEIVVCSGGLWPTEDDVTREALAKALNVSLHFDEALYTEIEAVFRRFGRTPSPNNRRQAYLPEGARPIPNPRGTAPGVHAEISGRHVFLLPGVPHELEGMLRDYVLPVLGRLRPEGQVIEWRELTVVGMGESWVDTALADLLRTAANPTVGLLASPTGVRIRLAVRATTHDEAQQLLNSVEAEVRARLGHKVLEGYDGVFAEVLRTLHAQSRPLTTVEVGTKGILAHQFGLASSLVGYTGARSLTFSEPAGAPNAAEPWFAAVESLWSSLPEGDRQGGYPGLVVGEGEPSGAIGDWSFGKFVDEMTRQLLYLPNECVLCLLLDRAEQQIRAYFGSPEGQSVWRFRLLDLGVPGITRAAALSAEAVRRRLRGFPPLGSD